MPLNKTNCIHEIIYKYIVNQYIVIYQCKKCKKNIVKHELDNKKIIKRSFI